MTQDRAIRGDGPEAAAVSPAPSGTRELTPAEQTWLERSFGNGLSSLRLHEGAAAREAAASQGARAFALGDDVVLGERLDATSFGDRALLAHEVAHVLQQRRGGGAGQRTLERDADVAAGRAVLGFGSAAPAAGGGLRLSRCESVESMTDQQLAEYLAANHFRIVVTQETTRFLSGMKKSVAVAANPEPNVQEPVEQPADELITAGSDYPRLTSVLVEMPSPSGSGGRMKRHSAVHQATGTFTVHFMSSGRYDLTATVAFAPGRTQTFQRSIDVEQADFVSESEAVAGEHLASQPTRSPAQERLARIVQRAELRERAAEAGALDRDVVDAWTDLSLAVAARVAVLDEGRSGPGTATAVHDAVTRFEEVLGEAPRVLRRGIAGMRRNAFTDDREQLRSSMDDLARSFDSWVHAQLQAGEGPSDYARAYQYAMQSQAQVERIERRAAGPAVNVPAVFHPEAAYVRRELFVSGPVSTGRIQMVPLDLWLFSEGGRDWTLRDISNPEEPFEYDTSADDREAALDDLLGQLAGDEERFPRGRLHVQRPDAGAEACAIEGDMDFLDWLEVAALILAAAGIIMVTAGAGSPGVVAAGGYLLTASAVAGGGAAIVDTVDAYERGRLSGKRLALNALQVVASAASAGTATIFASAARQGTGSLARIGANARYLVLNRTAAGADVVTLLVMSGDTAVQLASMGGARPGDEQAAMRAALAIGQLLVQGAMTVVDVRDAFEGDLSGHPAIELREGPGGRVTAHNPGAGAPDVAAGGPRTAEDLLDRSGRFPDEHEPLKEGYESYVQKCERQNREPLEPLEWVKFQSQGAPARYLNETLPEGWRAARQGQYPGSHPELIERPSNAPPEGSVDPTTGRRWRYRRVTVGELRREVDEAGDLYWTFPDLQEGEVLVLPSGTRVWKGPSGAIVEEHPVSESVSGERTRTQGEATVMSRAEMGPEHEAAGTERAHGAASPGLGFDSPYSVAHAPRQMNQILENHGIETYVRQLRDNAPEGVTYLFTTHTLKKGQNLQERVYDIAAIEGGDIHEMFQFKIEVEGLASARLVEDEVSVFTGAERFGSPRLQAQPASAPPGGQVGVDIPGVLRKALDREAPRDAAIASPLTGPLESSRQMRERLDDILDTKLRSGQLDQDWVEAHERATRVLHEAEDRLLRANVCTPDAEELQRLLTEIAGRAGRRTEAVDAQRLHELADRVDELQLD